MRQTKTQMYQAFEKARIEFAKKHFWKVPVRIPPPPYHPDGSIYF